MEAELFMSLPDILIPTCKDDWELCEQIGELLQSDRDIDGDRIIYSCLKASASVNRNKCLDLARSEIVVMIDDDMAGFFPGWVDVLVAPLINDPDVMMTSARLLNEDGSIGPMMGDVKNYTSPTVVVPLAPSACIAFRNDGTRFNEEMLGSQWEDTSFIFRLKAKYPKGKIVVCNECRLIHKHEMKGSKYGEYNKAIFEKEFPSARFVL